MHKLPGEMKEKNKNEWDPCAEVSTTLFLHLSRKLSVDE